MNKWNKVWAFGGVLVLITLALVGWNFYHRSESKINNSPGQIQEKGHENIAKIEITRYSYDQNRSYTSKKIEKNVSIEKSQDIKIFMELFNSKEKSSGMLDVGPMDYQVSIIKKDGFKEVYDMALSYNQVFFHNNGTGYLVNNPASVSILRELLSTYQISGVESIDVEHVAQLEISTGKNGSVNVIYTREKNLAELERFVAAYNKTTRFRDDVGTTPNIIIYLTLDTGEKIIIAGGTQGFQTVQRNGKQINIQGQELWDYFKKLL